MGGCYAQLQTFFLTASNLTIILGGGGHKQKVLLTIDFNAFSLMEVCRLGFGQVGFG